MNRGTLFTTIGIVLVIAGALIYTVNIPNKGMIVHEVAKSSPPSAPTTATPRPGVYLEYSKDTVLATKGVKLLFFHAPWCPQCRSLEESIKADGVPEGVTIFKVDYDSNQKLRQQYGVTIQTTFVKIDDAGNKIASYVAYEEPQIRSVTRELLHD